MIKWMGHSLTKHPCPGGCSSWPQAYAFAWWFLSQAGKPGKRPFKNQLIVLRVND